MTDAKPEQKMGKEEQIGFHKGALSTLAKERQEMGRILGIVEQLIQMHVQALQELGVDLTREAAKMQKAVEKTSQKGPKSKIEDML